MFVQRFGDVLRHKNPTTVQVLGCGATGSHAAYLLAKIQKAAARKIIEEIGSAASYATYPSEDVEVATGAYSTTSGGSVDNPIVFGSATLPLLCDSPILRKLHESRASQIWGQNISSDVRSESKAVRDAPVRPGSEVLHKAQLKGALQRGSHGSYPFRSTMNKMGLVDFDRVEEHNLEVQMLPPGSLGADKTKALSMALSFLVGEDPRMWRSYPKDARLVRDCWRALTECPTYAQSLGQLLTAHSGLYGVASESLDWFLDEAADFIIRSVYVGENNVRLGSQEHRIPDVVVPRKVFLIATDSMESRKRYYEAIKAYQERFTDAWRAALSILFYVSVGFVTVNGQERRSIPNMIDKEDGWKRAMGELLNAFLENRFHRTHCFLSQTRRIPLAWVRWMARHNGADSLQDFWNEFLGGTVRVRGGRRQQYPINLSHSNGLFRGSTRGTDWISRRHRINNLLLSSSARRQTIMKMGRVLTEKIPCPDIRVIDMRVGWDLAQVIHFRASKEGFENAFKTIVPDEKVQADPCDRQMSPIMASTAAMMAADEFLKMHFEDLPDWNMRIAHIPSI